MCSRIGTWRMPDSSRPMRGHQSAGGYRVVECCVPDRTGAGSKTCGDDKDWPSQWGNCGEATKIAQLVRRDRRLSTVAIPAAARSTADDDARPAPGRTGPPQRGSRNRTHTRRQRARQGSGPRHASALARGRWPRDDRHPGAQAPVEPHPGSGSRSGRRQAGVVTPRACSARV